VDAHGIGRGDASIYSDFWSVSGGHGMFLMPWVRGIVVLVKPTTQKACRGYPLSTIPRAFYFGEKDFRDNGVIYPNARYIPTPTQALVFGSKFTSSSLQSCFRNRNWKTLRSGDMLKVTAASYRLRIITWLKLRNIVPNIEC
jgi:hypothetical protein